MLIALLLLPALAALIAAFLPKDRTRSWVLTILGMAHLILTIGAIALRGEPSNDPITQQLWLRLDATGSIVLLSLSTLFALIGWYAPGYLAARSERPNRLLVICFCIFLGLTSVAAVSQHLGVMWACIEGATLCMTPMIYFNRNPRSLEAAWKYLMVGGTGVALALLGTFFLAYSAIVNGGNEQNLTYDALRAGADAFSLPWLRAAFVLLLVGYGTKMGLAPMHTWKPDAYGETPGMVGALLAGGMTSVAFLALLRVVGIMDAAGQGEFARQLLILLGLLSMGWAAVFMIRQTDIKRMLAYSSVEHMGILAVGLGLLPTVRPPDGLTVLPLVLLHVLGNSFAKTTLFLSAGNIHRAFASKHIPIVSGAILRVPVSAVLFLLGFLAATGSPPFSMFISEFGLIQGAVKGGHWWVAGLFLSFLVIIFIGFSSTVVTAIYGTTDAPEPDKRFADSAWTTVSPILGLVFVLFLGLWTPPPLRNLFSEAENDVMKLLPPTSSTSAQVNP